MEDEPQTQPGNSTPDLRATEAIEKQPGDDNPDTDPPATAVLKHSEQIIETTYSGPLPSPDALERYENILPGAADRILRITEERSTHINGLESQHLESRERFANKVLFAGTTIVLAGMGAASYLIHIGSRGPGTTVFIVDLAFAAIAALLRRPQKTRE